MEQIELDGLVFRARNDKLYLIVRAPANLNPSYGWLIKEVSGLTKYFAPYRKKDLLSQLKLSPKRDVGWTPEGTQTYKIRYSFNGAPEIVFGNYTPHKKETSKSSLSLSVWST